MKFKFELAMVLSVLFSTQMTAQIIRPSAPPPRDPPPVKGEFPKIPESRDEETKHKLGDDRDDIIKVDTKLVQVDAVVLDKNGKLVSDLKVEDFEILQGGKPQKIDFFSFVKGNAEATKRSAPSANANVAPPSSSSAISVERLNRTIALVVDDSCMSFESINTVRGALLDFVNSQMQEGDLVGIFRTRSGNGTLQQFTTDKNVLIKGIKNITLSSGLGCQDIFAPNRADYTLKQGQGGAATFDDPRTKIQLERMNASRRETTALGTIKTIQYLIRGMQNIPGRKSMILISDGLYASSLNGNGVNEINRTVNLANQSAVVIYSMNARGLFDNTMISAADEVLPFTGDGGGGNDIESLVTGRRAVYENGLDNLRYVAYSTGGTFINNTNNLNKGFDRILAEQQGYYLIGYQPDESTLKLDANFRKLTLKIKRPDLSVRHRFGFYGVINPNKQLKKRSEDSDLYQALVSPVVTNGVHLKLTPFIGNIEKPSFLRYVVHLDANDLTFTDGPGGSKKLALDIVVVTLGANGKLADEFNRTHTILVKGINMHTVAQNGMIYTGEFPVKKSGVYQIRVAIRDVASKRIGTASQYVEVPDPKDDSLSLSQIIISGATEAFPPAIPIGRKMEEALTFVESSTIPAVRIFMAGTALGYGYMVRNAKPDGSAKRPNLTSMAKIYRDGKLVSQVADYPIDVSGANNNNTVQDAGVIPLKADMVAGLYSLQVVVKDLNNVGKTATQWIDFELVK